MCSIFPPNYKESLPNSQKRTVARLLTQLVFVLWNLKVNRAKGLKRWRGSNATWRHNLKPRTRIDTVALSYRNHISQRQHNIIATQNRALLHHYSKLLFKHQIKVTCVQFGCDILKVLIVNKHYKLENIKNTIFKGRGTRRTQCRKAAREWILGLDETDTVDHNKFLTRVIFRISILLWINLVLLSLIFVCKFFTDLSVRSILPLIKISHQADIWSRILDKAIFELPFRRVPSWL